MLHLAAGGFGGAALVGAMGVFAVLSGIPVSSGRQLEARLGLPVIADWSDSKKKQRPVKPPALMQYLGGYRHRAILITAPEPKLAAGGGGRTPDRPRRRRERTAYPACLGAARQQPGADPDGRASRPFPARSRSLPHPRPRALRRGAGANERELRQHLHRGSRERRSRDRAAFVLPHRPGRRRRGQGTLEEAGGRGARRPAFPRRRPTCGADPSRRKIGPIPRSGGCLGGVTRRGASAPPRSRSSPPRCRRGR